MEQETLRRRVKIVRVVEEEFTYKELAQMINITPKAFYNWLNGDYSLSEEKFYNLKSIIDDILQ